MSLGWQTESAILPSKAKPIHVDNKSMVGLKALVLQQEQQLKLKQGSSQERTMRNLSKVSLYQGQKRQQDHEKSGHKNDNNNKSSSSTNNKNDTESDPQELAIEIRAQRALEAKARLYEEMSKGSVTVGQQSGLVDFNAKKKTRIEGNKEDDPWRRDNSGSSSHSENHYQDGRDGLERDSVKKGETSSRVLIYGYGPDQWQWNGAPSAGGQGNKEVDDHMKAYKEERQQERQYQHEIERRVEEEMNKPISSISQEARVKTQWEKTLNSSARDYLDAIHRETERGRESSGGDMAIGEKKSAREERLELLKRRREEKLIGTKPANS